MVGTQCFTRSLLSRTAASQAMQSQMSATSSSIRWLTLDLTGDSCSLFLDLEPQRFSPCEPSVGCYSPTSVDTEPCNSVFMARAPRNRPLVSKATRSGVRIPQRCLRGNMHLCAQRAVANVSVLGQQSQSCTIDVEGRFFFFSRGSLSTIETMCLCSSRIARNLFTATSLRCTGFAPTRLWPATRTCHSAEDGLVLMMHLACLHE